MQVADAGKVLAGDPVRFATNRLVLVAPAGNPAGIPAIDALAASDWVPCATTIPCARLPVPLPAANQPPALPTTLHIAGKACRPRAVPGGPNPGFAQSTT